MPEEAIYLKLSAVTETAQRRTRGGSDSDRLAVIQAALVKHGLVLLMSIREAAAVEKRVRAKVLCTLVARLDDSIWNSEWYGDGDTIQDAIAAARSDFLLTTFGLALPPDPAGIESDQKVFRCLEAETKQKEDGSIYYRLRTNKPGEVIYSFSREPFRQAGLGEQALEAMRKPGFRHTFSAPLLVTADLMRSDRGRYWLAVAAVADEEF